MIFFRFAMLLLVQISPIFVHISGEAVSEYKCVEEHTTEDINVSKAGALLAKGCVMKSIGITFDIKAMYDAASKTPKTSVIIHISEAAFIDAHIKLIKVHDAPDFSTRGPLLFTMMKSNLSGTTIVEFNGDGQAFNLPPNSRIRIIDSEMSISSTAGISKIFIFDGLQLVTKSTVEISSNVFSTKCKGCDIMNVFYLAASGMKISDESSFTLRNNTITMEGHTADDLKQYIWWQENTSPLTISDDSTYTWVSNIITMMGHDIDQLVQEVWYQDRKSPLTISKASIYKWESNNISMVGYEINDHLGQEVWYESSTSRLTISETSQYIWSMNSISMNGYRLDSVFQSVLYTLSSVVISVRSQFIFEYNTILLLVMDITSPLMSYVMGFKATTTGSTISGDSSMIWKNNCVGMGHKETDKRRVFGGMLTFSNKSEFLFDGNYITTTDKYKESGTGPNELVWGLQGDADIIIKIDSTLTIGNTKVYTNNATSGVTGSMLWESYLSIYNNSVRPTNGKPDVKWTSSPAKDSDGSPIPTLDNSNLQQHMCIGFPKIPVVDTTTKTLAPYSVTKPALYPNPNNKEPVIPMPITTDKSDLSATAISSTIPAVLITSVVFLYLYNW